MPIKKLREFLDAHHIKYEVISHSPSYTAQEIAGLTHIPGRELAKTVMLNADGQMIMAVLPASHRIDLANLKKAMKLKSLELASEEEFKYLFPDCETGAMPPFGNLYQVDVVVAKKLTEDEEIAFNAGTHRELVRLAYKDFERLVKPKILPFVA